MEDGFNDFVLTPREIVISIFHQIECMSTRRSSTKRAGIDNSIITRTNIRDSRSICKGVDELTEAQLDPISHVLLERQRSTGNDPRLLMCPTS
jgi:hypothetical protein